MDANRQREEVDRNYDSFRRQLSSLMAAHLGEHALLRDGEVVAFYRSAADAYRDGVGRFADRHFSIQHVTDEPIDLGFYSHAAA